MGAYLQKPITEKESHDESHPEFEFGVSKMQGWRQSMEVRAQASKNKEILPRYN